MPDSKFRSLMYIWFVIVPLVKSKAEFLVGPSSIGFVVLPKLSHRYVFRMSFWNFPNSAYVLVAP